MQNMICESQKGMIDVLQTSLLGTRKSGKDHGVISCKQVCSSAAQFVSAVGTKQADVFVEIMYCRQYYSILTP